MTSDQESYVSTRISQILSQIILSNMTQDQIEYAIHTWILNNVTYVNNGQPASSVINESYNNPYMALTTGETECLGYSMLFYKMLQMAGINAHIVLGSVCGNGHAWNMVQIDGIWYYTDVTFDTITNNKFYNVTESFLALNSRQWNDTGLPIADTVYDTSKETYSPPSSSSDSSSSCTISAPTITLNRTGWGTSSIVIEGISGSTDSQLNTISYQYQVNGTSGSWKTFTSATTISIAGNYTIYARAVDRAGNMSSISSVTAGRDTTAPSKPIITLSNTGWVNTSVTINNISGSSDSVSGVSSYQYQVDKTSGTWTTFTPGVTVSTSGKHTIYARAFDAAGNVSSISSATADIDTTAPSAPKITLSKTSKTGWVNTNFNITKISGSSDSQSGVSYYQYQLDSDTGTWTTFSSAVTISATGSHTIYARAVDKAGNISNVSSVTMGLDTTAPTAPTITLSRTDYENTNFTIDSINGSTDDLSEGISYQYQINSTKGSWRTFSSAVNVSTNGNDTIYARAIDAAGNVSSVSSATAGIDKTPPTKPTITLSCTGWTNTSVTINTISGSTDSISGVANYQYQIGSTKGTWTTFSTPVTISTSGKNIIYARTVDTAGNASAVSSAIAYIDMTPPTAPKITLSKTSKTGWVNTNFNISKIYGSADSQSGVSCYQYQIDSTTGTWTPFPSVVTVSTVGNHTIYAEAVDKAGNVSNVSSVTIGIDTTPPSAPTITLSRTDWGSTNFTINSIDGSTDDLSGVLLYQYQINSTSGSWRTFSSPVTVSTKGNDTIYARAVDTAGNFSTISSTTAGIDTTAPSKPTIDLSTTAGTSLTINNISGSSDSQSGVASYQYQIDSKSGTWTTFTTPVTVSTSGKHTIYAEAIDAVGNISAVSADTVNI